MGRAWQLGSTVGDAHFGVDGGSDPAGSSDPQDPCGGRRGADRARRHVRRDVLGGWPAQCPAGGVVEVDGVDGVVLDPFGAGVLRTLDYDLLFKWFLDMRIDQPAFDATVFTKNRKRILEHEVADEFFAAVVRQAKLRRYVSSEHFTVDGTLLKAWASHKSFKPKDGPPSDPPVGRNTEVQFHGEKRSNETHASTTDPEARLYRKSSNTAATLCFAGHLLMENRSALIVDAELTIADGYAERSTATEMLARLPRTARRRTVAGDKGYDTKGFVAGVRELGFTPHVAPNTSRQRSAIDGRTTRHPGHAVSMRIRKRVEEPFGWIKTIAGGRQLRYRGRNRNRAWFKITTAVYNLIRIVALDTQLA